MEILYSGTDKKLYDALKWMLVESSIDFEERVRHTQEQTDIFRDVFQIFVSENDWQRAASELERISNRQPDITAQPSHQRCYGCVFAILASLAVGFFGGFAAVELLM